MLDAESLVGLCGGLDVDAWAIFLRKLLSGPKIKKVCMRAVGYTCLSVKTFQVHGLCGACGSPMAAISVSGYVACRIHGESAVQGLLAVRLCGRSVELLAGERERLEVTFKRRAVSMQQDVYEVQALRWSLRSKAAIACLILAVLTALSLLYDPLISSHSLSFSDSLSSSDSVLAWRCQLKSFGMMHNWALH